MNVEELRTVQRTERQKDSLQHLRDSFYRDVADYIAERKEERERVAAAADDPYSSPDVKRITDEIETAEEVVESIYERRIGKIVKRATFAAAGMASEDDGLTAEERDLFEDLVDRIERNRETVLDTLAGRPGDDAADGQPTDEAERVDPDPVADPDEAVESAPDPEGTAASAAGASEPSEPAPDPDDLLAEAMGGEASGSASTPVAVADGQSSTETPTPEESPTPDGGDAVAAPASGSDPVAASASDDASDTATDRTMLRITRDVGEIFGVDEREYDLASEDVVTLPTPNAEPLLARDAAERLDD